MNVIILRKLIKFLTFEKVLTLKLNKIRYIQKFSRSVFKKRLTITNSV